MRLEPRPQILILNGVGSVGKSSTARALQAMVTTPFLYVAMDAFLDMLPKKLFGQAEGLVFETVWDQGKRCIVIRSGPLVEQAMVACVMRLRRWPHRGTTSSSMRS
jgi:chloramphenicol 3-O phosphotransferase